MHKQESHTNPPSLSISVLWHSPPPPATSTEEARSFGVSAVNAILIVFASVAELRGGLFKRFQRRYGVIWHRRPALRPHFYTTTRVTSSFSVVHGRGVVRVAKPGTAHAARPSSSSWRYDVVRQVLRAVVQTFGVFSEPTATSNTTGNATSHRACSVRVVRCGLQFERVRVRRRGLEVGQRVHAQEQSDHHHDRNPVGNPAAGRNVAVMQRWVQILRR